jgi:hypothetical protein
MSKDKKTKPTPQTNVPPPRPPRGPTVTTGFGDDDESKRRPKKETIRINLPPKASAHGSQQISAVGSISCLFFFRPASHSQRMNDDERTRKSFHGAATGFQHSRAPKNSSRDTLTFFVICITKQSIAQCSHERRQLRTGSAFLGALLVRHRRGRDYGHPVQLGSI